MLDYLRAALIVRLRSEGGASAVEYAMMVAMVGVIVGVALTFGDVVDFIFKDTLEKNDGVTVNQAP